MFHAQVVQSSHQSLLMDDNGGGPVSGDVAVCVRGMAKPKQSLSLSHRLFTLIVLTLGLSDYQTNVLTLILSLM